MSLRALTSDDGDVVLVVDRIGKRYGPAHLAVRDVSFDVRRGEFVSIVGPSGCGKTTLLKCVSGLIRPSYGQVVLNGDQEVIAPPPEMVLVFQDYTRSLFPWLRVRKNVEMPLKANRRFRKRLTPSERGQRVTEAIESVGLAAAESKYPWQLSGGMQQRVALARAIAFRPEILLLDEPFASVDALVREELEDLVLALQREYRMTTIFVTHDIDEAVYLSDRVFVLGPSPSVVVREVAIDMPRQRNQIETRSSPRFLELRNVLHDEIMRRPLPSGTPDVSPSTSATP